MSTIRQFQVTFDCAEPARLAAFWCEVLGYVVPDVPEGYATWEEYHATLPAEDEIYFACTDPSGAGPRVLFQRVPEGKVVKNRVHLDVRAAGTGLKGDERLAALEAECARLTALGATHVLTQRADGVNESCITMQDIEGNEFCLD
ncbi:VOC family protein [Actinacidiphila bryophytorum]|uniref:VOC family protein n=1 Tax=Actinacidiphila bryophytorum TaxID=1436133 RepID=UPI0021769D3E|nr:VOC family protein [Actinacidiphila bryophytorum]UWE10741.1 VOC family protein [Actinacidiphila bryophytorum]